MVVRQNKLTTVIHILQLPFGTSIVDIKAPLPPEVVQEPRYGARIYTMEYALLMVVPDYYRRDALEARTCLASLKDVPPLVSAAIDGGHTTRAGRVAGALRSIGREEMADELLRMMRQVGYTVTEENPFDENVYIHPYMDGNGRTARFVMNSQLVTAGYPWVVVPVERRQEYMSALEQASVEENIEGFARFIGSLMG